MTLSQREIALERANTIRLWRANAKKDMTYRRAMALIDGPPWIARTWKVGDLLKSVPKWGPGRTADACVLAGCTQVTTLERLSPAQRGKLIDLLERGPK